MVDKYTQGIREAAQERFEPLLRAFAAYIGTSCAYGVSFYTSLYWAFEHIAGSQVLVKTRDLYFFGYGNDAPDFSSCEGGHVMPFSYPTSELGKYLRLAQRGAALDVVIKLSAITNSVWDMGAILKANPNVNFIIDASDIGIPSTWVKRHQVGAHLLITHLGRVVLIERGALGPWLSVADEMVASSVEVKALRNRTRSGLRRRAV